MGSVTLSQFQLAHLSDLSLHRTYAIKWDAPEGEEHGVNKAGLSKDTQNSDSWFVGIWLVKQNYHVISLCAGDFTWCNLQQTAEDSIL